jgi:hypothetical protein
VDLTHYLVGLKDLLDVKDVEIKRLKKRIAELAYELELQKEPKPIRNINFEDKPLPVISEDQH